MKLSTANSWGIQPYWRARCTSRTFLTRASLRRTPASIAHQAILCLLGVFVIHVARAGQWQYESAVPVGPERALCDALLKRLYTLGDRCAADAIESFPGFSEPPWQDLDPHEHLDLISKLLKYWQVGPRKYFDSISSGTAAKDAVYHNKAIAFVSAGGRLRVWRTRLVPSFGNRPAPPGEQTVVELDNHIALASIPRECPGPRSKGWIPTLFLVTPDLSGPDPDIDAGSASILFARRLLLYNGIPELVDSDTVVRSFGDAGFHDMCAFKQVQGR